MATGNEPLPCGHPASSIRGRTTHWCADCEEEARAAVPAPVSAQSATGESDVTAGWTPDDRDAT